MFHYLICILNDLHTYLQGFLLGSFCTGLIDWLAGCIHASFAGGWGWVAGVEARFGRGVASNVESVERLHTQEQLYSIQIWCHI